MSITRFLFRSTLAVCAVLLIASNAQAQCNNYDIAHPTTIAWSLYDTPTATTMEEKCELSFQDVFEDGYRGIDEIIMLGAICGFLCRHSNAGASCTAGSPAWTLLTGVNMLDEISGLALTVDSNNDTVVVEAKAATCQGTLRCLCEPTSP